MEIEQAGKASILYQQLEDLRHKEYCESVYILDCDQKTREHKEESARIRAEIEKIKKEIADL